MPKKLFFLISLKILGLQKKTIIGSAYKRIFYTFHLICFVLRSIIIKKILPCPCPLKTMLHVFHVLFISIFFVNLIWYTVEYLIWTSWDFRLLVFRKVFGTYLWLWYVCMLEDVNVLIMISKLDHKSVSADTWWCLLHCQQDDTLMWW